MNRGGGYRHAGEVTYSLPVSDEDSVADDEVLIDYWQGRALPEGIVTGVQIRHNRTIILTIRPVR